MPPLRLRHQNTSLCLWCGPGVRPVCYWTVGISGIFMPNFWAMCQPTVGSPNYHRICPKWKKQTVWDQSFCSVLLQSRSRPKLGHFGRSRFECPAPSPAPSELWTLFTFVVQHWLNSIKKQIIKNLWIFFSQEGGVLLKLKMFLISWKLTFLLEPGFGNGAKNPEPVKNGPVPQLPGSCWRSWPLGWPARRSPRRQCWRFPPAKITISVGNPGWSISSGKQTC